MPSDRQLNLACGKIIVSLSGLFSTCNVQSKQTKRKILPNSSSMVLPPAVSLTPSTLLNRIEKALPHTPKKNIKNMSGLNLASIVSTCICRS